MAKVIIPRDLLDQVYRSIRDAAADLGTTKHYLNRYIQEVGIDTKTLPKGTDGFDLVKQSDLSGFPEWAEDNVSAKGRGRPKSTGPFSPEKFSDIYGIPKRDVETLMATGALRTLTEGDQTLIPYDEKNAEAIRSYKGGQIDCEAIRRLRGAKDREFYGEEPEDDDEGHDILLGMCSEYGLEIQARRILSEDPSLESTLVYLVGQNPGDAEKDSVIKLDFLLNQLKGRGNGYQEDFIRSLSMLKRAKSRSAHISLIQETVRQLVESEDDL